MPSKRSQKAKKNAILTHKLSKISKPKTLTFFCMLPSPLSLPSIITNRLKSVYYIFFSEKRQGEEKKKRKRQGDRFAVSFLEKDRGTGSDLNPKSWTYLI